MASLGLVVAAVFTAGCQDTGARPTTVIAAPNDADQVLTGFSTFIFDLGLQRSHVEADTAYFYEASQLTELRRVRAIFYNLQGKESSTLTAKRGRYRWQDGSMEAHDSVVVVSPDGRKLRTASLRYDNASNTIWTDKPFTFDSGPVHLEGNSFKSDTEFRNVVTDRPRGVAGQGMTLPGQNEGDTLP
jgi:LPS export ABC transporter protein LptC